MGPIQGHSPLRFKQQEVISGSYHFRISLEHSKNMKVQCSWSARPHALTVSDESVVKRLSVFFTMQPHQTLSQDNYSDDPAAGCR